MAEDVVNLPPRAELHIAHRRATIAARARPAGRSLSRFVALSRFTIRNGMAAQVRQAFAERPHLVDRAPGFLGMRVMSPLDNQAEIWLVTRWGDEPSYRSWHKGHEVDYLHWLAHILTTRHVPAEHLALSLEWLAEFFGTHMEGADGQMVVGALRQAKARFEGGAPPPPELDALMPLPWPECEAFEAALLAGHRRAAMVLLDGCLDAGRSLVDSEMHLVQPPCTASAANGRTTRPAWRRNTWRRRSRSR